MDSIIAAVLRGEVVELTNERGSRVTLTRVAIAGIGLYDSSGAFWSRLRILAGGYRPIK